MKKIALVVPCYNEEAVLPRTAETLLGELGRLVAAGELLRPATHYHRDAAKELAKLLLAKFSMPSFATGKPADVLLCKIVVK